MHGEIVHVGAARIEAIEVGEIAEPRDLLPRSHAVSPTM